jgi:hypothetical protein
MADQKHDIDLSNETTSHPVGHSNLVWLWVLGLIVFSAAIWGVTELIITFTPRGMPRTPLP